MKNIIAIAAKGWGLIDTKSKKYLYYSVTLFIITTLFRISTPLVFAYLVGVSHQPLIKILPVFFGYALLFCLVRFCEEFRLACYIYFEQILQKSLVLATLKHFFCLPFSDAARSSSSETAIIIDRGLGGLRSALYSAIFTLLPLWLECLMILAVVSYQVSIMLALKIVLLLLLFIGCTWVLSARTQRLQQKWFATASTNYQLMSEGIRAYESLRVFQRTDWVIGRYTQATDHFIAQVKNSLRPGIQLGLIQGLLLLLLFFATSYDVMTQAAAPEDRIRLLVLVNGLLLQIVIPLLQFSSAYRLFIQGISSAQQLFDLLQLPSTQTKINHTHNDAIIGFKLTALGIDYPGGKRIDYDDRLIPHPVVLLITGSSGCGKSSLAKALAGIKAYRGCIETTFKPDEIFYLHQHVDIFDVSLEENITLGQPFDPALYQQSLVAAGFTMQECQALAERPLGEMGAHVSGGQAQRIGLARMHYHQAKVLIFDEPTTGLDDQAVEKVLAAIQACATGRTVIIVSHDQRIRAIGNQFISLR